MRLSEIHRRSWPGRAVGLLVLLVAACAQLEALPMGPRQIADFERESRKVLRELLVLPGEESPEGLVVKLTGTLVSGLRVHAGRVELWGLTPAIRDALMAGGNDFEAVRKLRSIRVEAVLKAADLEALVTRRLAEIRETRKMFDQISIAFGDGSARVSGLVDLARIPGNPFALLPQPLSPFEAQVGIFLEGSEIHLDIVSAQVNHQPMTPELKAQVVGWLNPVWDNGQLPYPATLERVAIRPEGLAVSGWLFAADR